MTALARIAEALAGWRDLARGRGGWRDRFLLSRAGLAGAAALFLVAVLANVTLQMVLARQVTASQAAVNLAVNLLPLAGLGLAIGATVAALQRRDQLYVLLVPATYLLAFALLVGLPLSLVALPSGPVLLAGLAYLLYRLGRAACSFSVGLGVAFAALCLVLLVAVPATLYMLLATIPGIT